MTQRRRARLRGHVQGVGMRPFVANLARRCELAGFVANDEHGVVIEVEGSAAALDRFAVRVCEDAPPHSRIDHVEWHERPVDGATGFSIAASSTDGGHRRPSVAPDAKVCTACLGEVRDPSDRRHGYAFTTCASCGPRLSIADALPFDRERTSMAAFTMCSACDAEYGDPDDRRYHAQTVSCPRCGPRLGLLGSEGELLGRNDEALRAAVQALRRGRIVALLGIGGFQLLVDATDEAAVARLRERKARPAKPLAIMVRDLDAARALARLDAAEEAALSSSVGPIVLVDRHADDLARSVAPDRSRLGIMLPTTPLHALVLDRFGGPLVATSGNRRDEPICVEVDEARDRLAGIADAFLVHDRRVARRSDDSVVQVVAGRPRVVRLGRGLCPTRITLPTRVPILAVGGHLKQAPVLAWDGEAVLWPHVGDLLDPAARVAMADSIADLERTCGVKGSIVAVDAHPDYASTRWAEASGRRVAAVWHHHAHAAAVMAEYDVDEALAFTWDGVGLGADGAAWGGEVLQVSGGRAKRVAHLHPFVVPAGDAAARDGRRALAGLRIAAGLDAGPASGPTTTSVGRLFDGVAALTGVCSRSRYEGEAAARLEELVPARDLPPYPFSIAGGSIDWRPALAAMSAERDDAPRVAGRFHATLSAIVVEIAAARRASTVVLGGGCFQNRTLAQSVLGGLERRGVRALLPARVPVSDGGLALGQAWVVARR